MELESEEDKPIFNFSFKVKCVIILVIGLVFYANSITNEYALDDGIIITQNEFVQEGFAGIGGILTHDAYYPYYHAMNANQMLAGGRYRPLSIVVFAIEHAFFDESPVPRHAGSILMYLVCIFLVFYFLDKCLLANVKKGEDIAFLAAILFTIHPMHTEVVANAKSLDELLSLSFIMLTFIFALRYGDADPDERKTSDLVLASVFFFLALLAKEYAMLLIFLLPLLFYTVSKKTLEKSILSCVPYFGVFILYLIIRISSVGVPHKVPDDEILNNPYLLAKTASLQAGSKVFVLGKYLYMLFVPYPLSADYSYDQLPYRNIWDPMVLLCIALYGAIIIWGIRLLLKRRIIAFPIFFYLANLSLVSNFVFTVGATMGERLVFHSSVGFVTLLAYCIVRSPSFIGKNVFIYGGLAVAIIACGIECVQRNALWKNDITLFTHDVNVVPNSVMVNGNAGARFLDLADAVKDTTAKGRKEKDSLIHRSIELLSKSVRMHDTYTNSYLNLGLAYWKLGMPDSSKKYWDKAKQLYPSHPNLKKYYPLLANLYLDKAREYDQKKNTPMVKRSLINGLFADNTNGALWRNLGTAYFLSQQYDSARYAWDAELQLNPKDTTIKRAVASLPVPKTKVTGIR